MKKVLLIIASKDFQPIEYGTPRTILEDENIKVFTASDSKDKLGNAISADGSPVKVDFLIDDVNVKDFDGIFIIGGPGAMEHLDNERTYRIIQEIDREINKAYGAICISTRILAHADVLDGRKVTGWDKDNKLKDILKDYNAEYIHDTDVVIDRNLVTATGPEKAQEFGEAILKVLYSTQVSTAE